MNNVNYEENAGVKQCREIKFCKKKMFSYMTYKTIYTNVKIFSDKMSVYQEVQGFFGKPHINTRDILISNIRTVDIRTVFDFWDTLYAVIFILLGFVIPFTFILAIMFAFCGYGKVAEIQLLDGSKFEIPFSKENNESNELLLACRKR